MPRANDSFDRWLNARLDEELRRASATRAIPAGARYRSSHQASHAGWRGILGTLVASTAGKLLIATAAVAVAGTTGAEVTGNGPVKLGVRGPFIQVGVGATPTPVIIPTPTDDHHGLRRPSDERTARPERENSSTPRTEAEPESGSPANAGQTGDGEASSPSPEAAAPGGTSLPPAPSPTDR